MYVRIVCAYDPLCMYVCYECGYDMSVGVVVMYICCFMVKFMYVFMILLR